jgi:predicted amidohydrolase
MKKFKIVILIILVFSSESFAQQKGKAKIAVIQANKTQIQDPFMEAFDHAKVRPQMMSHVNKLLDLFEEAGESGADLVCGPEDMQQIGAYGLHINVNDPETGKILFNSLAVPVPGALTDKIAKIARRYNMYIIAPIYEEDGDLIYNTAVFFDRQGNIMGKHRKTLLPIMETWLVATGDEYPVFKTDFGNVAIATCAEISYPEISSVYALKGADIIFNPTMAKDNKPGQSLETAPMFITRARDNSVYIAPVVLGNDGNGIIDFNGNVVAEAVGEENAVIMAEIDFSKERVNKSKWWETINGTNNIRAMHVKSRRPDIYELLSDPNPPLLEKYKDIHLTTGDRERQLEAVREVDYGPKKKELYNKAKTSDLSDIGLHVIPYPQEVVLGGSDFTFSDKLTIVLDETHSDEDRFTAEELADALKNEWNLEVEISGEKAGKSIMLTRKDVPESLKEQGYRITTSPDELTVAANSGNGLFYGTQTVLQLIQNAGNGFRVAGMKISDWPDIETRAVHYDTKHHQDKRSYVESFIRDLARYKINMLIWEWEDKFEYPSHPEIGAPGAFTMEEMQEMTRFAQKYHIQIVPLVQGLGHVSYILKWPQYSHLREIPASNWEFCPLKEGSYELLNDLWQDAIKATPGSEYIHIGCDETYELGQGVECGCEARAKEIGKRGLMTEFINRSAKPLMKEGRTVMAWSAQYDPESNLNPHKGMITLGRSADIDKIKETRQAGYKVYVYDPNPGIEPLFLPYFYKTRAVANNGVYDDELEEEVENALMRSYNAVSSAANTGIYDGMINTSWDDSGLHNQAWMMSFIHSAEYSWSGGSPSLDDFTESFFLNYYGKNSVDMKELYILLNKASYYYYKSLERRVWHYGDIGKTHLPDLPRGDNLEYDEFWNREYAGKIKESLEQLKQMERADQIIRANYDAGIKNSYDLEIFESITELVKHTCNTYLALSCLERAIKEAHKQRFVSHEAAYTALLEGLEIIDGNLAEREKVYNDLVATWEKTRLPKGLSTPEKQFFHRQDRARHFAFRRADMSYLICDEELLGLEDYRSKLREYADWYRKTFL